MVEKIVSVSSHFLNPQILGAVFPLKSNNWERSSIDSRLLPARDLSQVWNHSSQAPLGVPIPSAAIPAVRTQTERWLQFMPSATHAALVVGLSKPRKKKIDVLVIEDSIFQHIPVRRLLESLNCFVTIAESGERGLSFCKKTRYDIIFMDLELPGINGIAATQRIRRTNNLNEKTFITALTSHDEPEIKQAAFAAGMNDYLIKPLDRIKAKKVLALLKK